MTALVVFSLWAIVTSSCLLCTDAIYTSHSKYDGPSHRGGPRRAQSEGDTDAYLFDLSDKIEDGFQKDDRSTGDDVDKSWPIRGGGARQRYGVSDSDSEDASKANYLLDEEEAEDSSSSGNPKDKRESHSLSIVNPLDVLRQRLMLEMARRRMQENQDKIKANDIFLKSLGKRSLDARTTNGHSRRQGYDSDGFPV